MKNTWKRIFAATLCLLLAFAFTGCSELDEARANQAFAKGYGEVLWNGNLYKALPENDYFRPVMTGEQSLCLTEEDVPVLLSSMFNLTFLDVSEDKVLLQDYAGQTVYCREDRHDEMSRWLTEPFQPEELCFQYGYYDYEQDLYIEGFHTLTKAQEDAIDKVLKEVTPWTLDNNTNVSGWSIIVQESSKDHLMRRDHVEIVVEGLSAYLLVDAGKETIVYTVPDALRPIFMELATLYENVW